MTVTHDSARLTFTITAKNNSSVPCHLMDVHVLGEPASQGNPSDALLDGLSDGKLTEYHDVQPGATVSQTLDAHLIVQSLPASDSFLVAAVGYCMDGR